jgi:very-short-patch-repair endonuclease
MLVIELDGTSHDSVEAIEKDKERDVVLNNSGFTVMRIRDEDVMANITGVIWKIKSWIEEHHLDKLPDNHALT